MDRFSKLSQGQKIVVCVILIVFILCVLYLALIGTLNLVQKHLLYPGRHRECKTLEEPFTQIENSFFKPGTSQDLWVFLGGNNSIPSDYSHYAQTSEHNCLLITYPGYNCNEADPNPDTMADTIKKCLDKLKDNPMHKKFVINFVCFSIGTGVGLYFLSKYGKDYNIKKVILLAPFWSIDEIVWDKCLIPQSVVRYLLIHNYENHLNLLQIPKDIEITIAHGKSDEIISHEHSLRLNKLRKSKLIITDDDTHLTINRLIPELIK